MSCLHVHTKSFKLKAFQIFRSINHVSSFDLAITVNTALSPYLVVFEVKPLDVIA